jgi:NAD(P)-dependent dehydrogenase (short-subunit alcohol dehydrogenase family)
MERGSRIVNVASRAHFWGRLQVKDGCVVPGWSNWCVKLVQRHHCLAVFKCLSVLGVKLSCKEFTWCACDRRFLQYAQSKLCNVLFTAELQRRLQERGILATSVSPGFVNTTIFRWAALLCSTMLHA